MASAKEYINEALSIAMHVMKAAIHSTLGSSPGSLTFNRDMFPNIPLIADTFSRLLCSYVSSPLVGKKAANVVSNSESNNRNESSHSLLM